MQQINPLKKINLQQYQKPKTLIVVHYKGKRISVPLLGDCKNLTEMLYHHIDKFQQTVLKNESNWQILSKKKIVCFSSCPNSNQKNDKQTNTVQKTIQRYLKYSDGDLKIDLLLSFIRIQQMSNNYSLDITKYYKYMQIEPYFIEYPLRTNQLKRQNNKQNKYYLYRLIQKNRIKNVYLGRNLQNGYFYSIKIYRNGLSMAQNEARFLSVINNQIQQKQQRQGKNPFEQHSQLQLPDSIIPKTEIYLIPSSEQEDQQDQQQAQLQYKHLAIAHKYNIRGKLSDKLSDKSVRITEKQLLKYLKQLVWIVHTLHEQFNIIHRNLTPQSFQIDQLGDLKLTAFNSWLQCYNQDGSIRNYPLYKENSSHNRTDSNSSSRIYEEQFQLASDSWYRIGHYTPTEVLNKTKQGYNKYVDYYTIGIVINQISNKVYEWQHIDYQQNSTKSKLVQKMVQGLTSSNYKQRENIALQIIQGIRKSKQQQTSRSQQQTHRKKSQILLNLSQIKLGFSINIDNTSTCVQNQQNDLNFNGIYHQQIIDYFKPTKQNKYPIQQQSQLVHHKKKQNQFKQKKKFLNINGAKQISHSNISNSRDKSVKSIKSNKSNKSTVSNAKPNTSKDKTRTKSKLINQNGDKINKNIDKLKNKSKSKSHKKITLPSPERNSFNTHLNFGNSTINNNNNKKLEVQLKSQIPNKKSKSKSCNKIKNQKSLQKIIKNDHKQKQKQKSFAQTVNAGKNKNQFNGILNRTNIPLPKNHILSPKNDIYLTKNHKSPHKNV